MKSSSLIPVLPDDVDKEHRRVLDRADDNENTQRGYRLFTLWINNSDNQYAEGANGATGDRVARTKLTSTQPYFVFDMFSTMPSSPAKQQRSQLATLPLPEPTSGSLFYSFLKPIDLLKGVHERTHSLDRFMSCPCYRMSFFTNSSAHFLS